MMKFLIRSACAAAALIWASPSYSDDNQTVFFKKASGWSVFSDKTMGNSCFVASGFEDGTTLRFGFNEPTSGNKFYIAFTNIKWKSIEDGKDYSVIIQMDSEPKWHVTGSGRRIGDLRIIKVDTNNSGFISELVKKHGIAIIYKGQAIAKLSLKGSSDAVKALLECQDAIKLLENNSIPSVKDDPFSIDKLPDKKDDPFA